jgi:purine catabolism regulator
MPTAIAKRSPAIERPPSDMTGISDFGITVDECLLITPLNQATIVAGRGGLTRRMNWVHVVDHRDMEDSLDTHELLLTSGIALAADRALQREIFEIMDRKQSAGLVIAIGDYITEIPAEMRELADLFEIPLIAIPWEVNFGDITRVLLTQFVESQYRFMELSQALNQALLSIVLQKGELQAVCDCISKVVGVASAICNESFKPLTVSRTGANFALLDEPVLRAALSASTFNRDGRTASQILTLDGKAAGVAAPIHIAERRRGYIVLEGGNMSPGLAGRLAEGVATIAALVIAHEDELLRVARRADGQLIALLDGTLPPSVSALGELGLKSSDPVYVVVASIETGDLPTAQELIGEVLRRRAGAHAIAIRGRTVVGLVQKPRGRTAEWSAALIDHLRDNGLQALIGVSGAIATFGEIPSRHDDVKELMRLRHYLQPDESIVYAEHATVLLRALRNLTAGADLEDICPAIIKIREHDRSLHGSLIEALACLLEVDWNVSLAARRLGIHRHTMLYRLDRMTEILGTEIKASMRFELRLQLLAWRLAGN